MRREVDEAPDFERKVIMLDSKMRFPRSSLIRKLPGGVQAENRPRNDVRGPGVDGRQ